MKVSCDGGRWGRVETSFPRNHFNGDSAAFLHRRRFAREEKLAMNGTGPLPRSGRVGGATFGLRN
jgi:hypothetical protein